MDKEWIKIDDLIRQRLTGAADDERPGGWSSMRDLLDREMPQVPPRTGGPRAIRYTALLLLASTLAVGSYTFLRPASAPDVLAEKSIHTPASVGIDSRTLTASNVSSPSPALAAANAPAPAGAAASQPSNTPTVSAATPAVQPENQPATVTAAVKPSLRTRRKTTTESQTGAPSTPPAAQTALAAVPGSSPRAGAEPARQAKTLATAPVASQPLQSSVATTNSVAAASRTGVPLVPVKPDTQRIVVRRDTIQQLRIVHRLVVNPLTRTGTYRSDTQILAGIVVEKTVLAELTKPAPVALSTEGLSRRAAKRLRRQWAAKMHPQPSAPVAAAAPPAVAIPIVDAVAAKSHAEAKLVPLAASRIDSRPTGMAWNPQQQLQNLVQNARTQLAQTKYYFGLLAGINSTVAGPGSLQGFQFGVTGLMAFNEKLALGAELKYFQRYNGSKDLRDDHYTTQRFVDGGSAYYGAGYTIYRYDRDSSARTFKFDAISSLELPISLRYAFNRFSVLAGVNLAYAFRVNAEEVEQKYAKTNRYDTVALGMAPAEPVSRLAQVSYDDFRARFGVGYVAGATYQLSPAVHLDLRIAQQLWDNYRQTVGGRLVSNTYYQLPNLQLSVGYRFQQQTPRPRE